MNPPRRTSRRERAPSPHPSPITEPHRCSTADSCRTLSTIFGNAPMTVSTSSATLSFPNEKRSAATPSSRGTPIALSTCDGSTAPVLQAGSELHRPPQSDDPRHVLRARPQPELLPTAVDDRFDGVPVAYEQRADPLGSADLVAGNGDESTADVLERDRDLAERLNGVR